MLDNGREIIVAAPTIAEMMRQEGGTKTIPRRRGVEVVAFDDRAAEMLGREASFKLLQETAKKTGHSKHYIQYDALIVACAARYRATHIITLDTGLTALATKMKLTIAAPDDFLKAQTKLPHVK